MEIRQIKPTAIHAPALKRVGAYARVSTEKQATLDSLSSQVSYYNDYIGNHPGWLFAGVYADYGLTGTKSERPEFQRMLCDARAGKIDIIITKSITRFARNTVTLLQTVRELKELGIEVIFEKEDMSSLSPDIDLLMTLLAMYAEEESRSASENKRWQIQKDFEVGKATFFRMYGYRWMDGHLEVVPEEAGIIRRIYREYLDGAGKEAIARKLNQEGIPSMNSKWRPSTIHEILYNEKYVGNMLLQKKITLDFRTKKQVRNKGQATQYYVENSHEPIIDPETFEAVQVELERRKKLHARPNDRKVDSIFYGLVKCAQCGKMYRCKNQKSSSSNNYFLVWRCATFMDLGKVYCPAKQIRDSILKNKACEVLGLPGDTDLTREIVVSNIVSIESAAGNQLRFFLKSGNVETVTWENPSRSSSWTQEMRENAKQKSLNAVKRRKEANHE